MTKLIRGQTLSFGASAQEVTHESRGGVVVGDDGTQVALNHRNAIAFHRHVRAEAHRNAKLGLASAGASLIPSPASATKPSAGLRLSSAD